MLPIVELSPLLDQNFGFSQAQKNLTVQAFIAKTVVEAFHVAVLPRATRIDVDRSDPQFLEPFLDFLGDELGSIVAADVFRNAAACHHFSERVEHILAAQFAINFDG